jgi:prepilin peptidase CpaA
MDWQTLLLDNWHVKLVCLVLIVAAWIDGKELRVPNWITFPMVLTGIAFNVWVGGWTGLGESLLGMTAGLLCLLPLYAVGGMGAGDVKLMAGMGAWLGWKVTVYAFCVSTVVGALMAVAMVWWKGDFQKHSTNFLVILNEWATVRDPAKLAEIAAERKPRMMLLPYGIPICVGSIAYFFYAGMVI